MDLKYPEVSDRIKATFTDGLIVILLLAAVGYYFQANLLQESPIKVALFISIFFGYDPLLVAFRGGTFGHKLLNLKVKKSDNIEQNISFIAAFIRFIIKLGLGSISSFTVTSDEHKRAIHDRMVNSTVNFIKK